MANFFDTILKILDKRRSPSQSYGVTGTTAAPRAMPQNISSIFDLIQLPQQARFNTQAAQGTNPGSYKPTAISMTGIPVASVFGLPGASAMPQNVFNVAPPRGTNPKNYKPAQIAMNAPSLAGPAAMQQMLALMGKKNGATPFAPYGQG